MTSQSTLEIHPTFLPNLLKNLLELVIDIDQSSNYNYS